MNKTEFLNGLEKHLKYVPKEDRDDALGYYSEYIDDMNFAENEDVCTRLGKPKDVAKNIIAECAEKTFEKHDETKNAKNGAKVVWMTILLICSLPVTLPLAIALVAVFIVIVVAITIVLLTLGLTGLGVLVAGLICLFFSILLPGFGQKLLGFGTGLIIAAVGAFLLLITILFSELFIKLIIIISKSMIKGKNKEEDNE